MIDFRKFKGIIFDLDGTLIDSMSVWERIDVEFLGKRGYDVPHDYLDKITPMGFEACAVYTKERFDLKESPREIIEEWYSMAIDAYTNKVKTKPGVKQFLEYLSRYNVKMAIATASDNALVLPALKNNGISEYFDNITTVREAKLGKGFPDVYDLAAKKMGFNNTECAVFEDIYEGMKGAKMGDYFTVGVYEKSCITCEEKLKEICDIYIHDFSECIIDD